MKSQDLKIDYRDVKTLIPYAKNARKHSDAQVAQIACEKTGRRARLIELDPQYVDMAVDRWQNYTGRQATLEGDGRTFAEITDHRRAA
jgi:hypothetical protein